MLRRCLVPPAALPVFEATARTVNILGLLFAYEGNNLRKTLNNLCFIMTAAGTNHRFQRSVYDRVTELGKIDRVRPLIELDSAYNSSILRFVGIIKEELERVPELGHYCNIVVGYSVPIFIPFN